MRNERAKSFVFVNGKLEMHRIIKVRDWIDLKTLKPAKPNPKVNYPTTLTKSKNINIEFSCKYVAVFSARNGRGLFMTISLYNPMFNNVDGHPLKTLAECSNPDNLGVPYA